MVLLFCLAVVRADASSDGFMDAIESWDTHQLQVVADQASDPTRQALALAVLDAFAGRDAVAISSLEKLTVSGRLDGALRFAAFRELGRLDLRNQRYVRAAQAFESALVSAGTVARDEADEVEDDLRYARANLTVLPMTVTVRSREVVPLVRDSMDLPRASVRINGTRVDAILDTGASNSVVSASTARRLQLRRLNFDGGVAADGRSVAARFAVADVLLVAGHELRNVPFIVLPDEAVTVPLGDGVVGRFEPIVGLSVLRKLGRLEISRHGDQETLRTGGASTSAAPPNILLPRGLPIVRAYAGVDATELRLSLDTGSNRTSLSPDAIAAHPALGRDASRARVGMASAAGVQSNDTGSIIPQLTLRIGAVPIPLAKVPVAAGPDHCAGTLGQDVLRSGDGYVIDFNRMTIEILPAQGAR